MLLSLFSSSHHLRQNAIRANCHIWFELLIRTAPSTQGPNRVLVTNSEGLSRCKLRALIFLARRVDLGKNIWEKGGSKRQMFFPVRKIFLSYDCDLGGGGPISRGQDQFPFPGPRLPPCSRRRPYESHIGPVFDPLGRAWGWRQRPNGPRSAPSCPYKGPSSPFAGVWTPDVRRGPFRPVSDGGPFWALRPGCGRNQRKQPS